MRARLVSLLLLGACGFNPTGTGDHDATVDDDALTADGAEVDGAALDAADPDAAVIDAAMVDAATIDAAVIDAAVIDAAADPYCTGGGLQACYRMNHGSGAPIDSHAPPLGIARADGANYVAGCSNRGTALDLGAGVVVRTDEPTDDTGDLTVEAWVKLDGPLAVSADRRYLLDAAGEWSLSYTVTGSNTVLVQCEVSLNGGTTPNVTASLSGATSWNHLACTWDSSKLRLFLNGTMTEENPDNRGIRDVTTNGIQVGRQGVDQAGFVDGLIDDVRIWNVRVPDAAIRTEAASGCP